MFKTKKFKVLISALVIFSMAMMYGYSPIANAASLESAKDTLSTSEPGVTATHTIVIDMTDANPLSGGEYIKVTFANDFTTVSNANATCPTGTTAGGSGQEITCTVTAGGFLAATSTQTVTVTSVTNPSTNGDYTVDVGTYDSGNTEIEATQMKVYIIETVSVTAHVDSTLSFAVGTSTPSDSAINGVNISGTSTPTTIPFGTIQPETQYMMAQILTVSTNADSGYVVTVQQSDDMKNAAGADIDPLITSATTTWPADVTTNLNIADESTYGYMAITTDDSDYHFGDGYEGFNGTTPIAVMTHDGPAGGTGTGVGTTRVGYSIEITNVQEAGDYSNTLTYICTPTY